MAIAILHHGKKDGLEVYIPPRVKIPDELSVAGDTYFALGEDRETISVMQGELNDSWHSFQTHVYKCTSEKDGEGRNIFHYHSSVMVERCHAATKSGEWCKNQAEDGGVLCKTHARAKVVPEMYFAERM